MCGVRRTITISVPPNAGEPLQRVTITQREGADDIRFGLEDTRICGDAIAKESD